MPELPEVETVVRGLASVLSDRVIVNTSLTRQDLYRSGSRKLAWLRGGRVRSVDRMGKAIVIRIDGPREPVRRVLVVHLGMTGSLVSRPGGTRIREKHRHARIRLDDGIEVAYVDPRRFGFFLVGEEDAAIASLRIAPDPFQLTGKGLVRRLEGRTAPVKSLLLNQRIVSGLGNIYVDETLHVASMHPLTPGRVAADRGEELVRAARGVLRRAIRNKGTTLRDYRQVDGTEGRNRQQLRVYGRDGEPCLTCGSTIERMVIAGRSSHFCPRCQNQR